MIIKDEAFRKFVFWLHSAWRNWAIFIFRVGGFCAVHHELLSACYANTEMQKRKFEIMKFTHFLWAVIGRNCRHLAIVGRRASLINVAFLPLSAHISKQFQIYQLFTAHLNNWTSYLFRFDRVTANCLGLSTSASASLRYLQASTWKVSSCGSKETTESNRDLRSLVDDGHLRLLFSLR